MSEEITRGERTRQSILLAAHDLFIQQGYHGTSMRQIAREASVALGGLYNHFDSKEQVFEAVFFEFHPYHEVLPSMQAARGETLESYVRNALDRILSALQQRPNFMNLMFIEIVEFKSAHVNQLFSQLVPYEIEIIHQVQQDNQDCLRPIPPLMLLRAFFGLIFSYYLTEIVFSTQAPPEFREDALEYMVDIFLYGVSREPPCELSKR